MTSIELKSTLVLAFIFATRMLGLFMVLPVFALYHDKIPGATPSLLGLAVGIYGFTTALLQLPYGMLSDYLGRRSVILAGLIVFAVGSLIAAFSDSIWGIIIGRAVQGAGAIGSPILAYAADLTRETVRTRAMALIGVSIGLTFVLAILLGPLLDTLVGLKGLFLITAGLSSIGMLLLLGLTKETTLSNPQPESLRVQLLALWHLKDFRAVSVNIFVLHAMFTASFLVLPLKIQEITSLFSNQVWKFYVPVLALSLLLMMPLLRYADQKVWQKKFMQIAMLGLGVCIMMFMKLVTAPGLVLVVTLFFMFFNFLEASLPALVSRIAPKNRKGSAMGVYSCAQFLGIFSGGALGGYLLQTLGIWGIGVSCLIFALIGWINIRNVEYLSSDNQSEYLNIANS